MLQIKVPALEQWDDAKQEFIVLKEQTLQLEHSLVSLSKWESKWCKSFLSSKEDMTEEQAIDYIRCMTLNHDVDPETYKCLPNNIIEKIYDYIYAPMTATILPKDRSRKNSREPITSELIYYWMVALNIPFECQKWHLNRLITLIGVCNIKNAPPKKRSQRDIMSRNAALNASRRKRLNSRG